MVGVLAGQEILNPLIMRVRSAHANNRRTSAVTIDSVQGPELVPRIAHEMPSLLDSSCLRSSKKSSTIENSDCVVPVSLDATEHAE